MVTGDAPAARHDHRLRSARRAERLRAALGAGEVVLLVPPGAESYVERIAAPRRPLRLPGRARRRHHRRGGAPGGHRPSASRPGTPDRALLTLAPLFERHDPAAVAAALFELWTSAAGAAAPAALPDIPATARIYVGVGKKDGATVNDLVAVLTKELRVERGKIGRVELRDAFSLVEIPAQDAERVAEALNGTTIRRKRVTARVDRGGPAAPARGRARQRRAARQPTAGEALALPVHQILQRPAGPERRHHRGLDGDGLAGARIAPLARRPLAESRSCRTR